MCCELKMRIGVIGAGGRLGGFIIDTAVEHGFSVTAIARQRRANWPDTIMHVHHSDRSDYSALLPVFDSLDTIIVAAGLTSTAVHRLALQSGCHVIDVGISESNIRECFALSDLAKSNAKCLIMMAGLAPGLIGLLASYMTEKYSTAKTIDICLVQNAAGTAGEQGTRDMLDMLTDRDLSPVVNCSIAARIKKLALETRAFTFPMAEVAFLPDLPAVAYRTKFNQTSFNLLLKVLRALRTVSPSLYCYVREKAAAQKKSAMMAKDERILLSAVAMAEDGRILGTAAHTYRSDYGATAAVAVALAELAGSGKLTPGAGHPYAFTKWNEIVSNPIVYGEELDD